MKKVSMWLAVATTAVLGLGLATVAMEPAYAAELSTVDPAKQLVSNNDNVSQDDFSQIVTTVINFILALLGILCVGIIIMGGVKYTTSQGDATKVQSATKTILYGVVGLVVALLAYAIVNFVLNNLFT